MLIQGEPIFTLFITQDAKFYDFGAVMPNEVQGDVAASSAFGLDAFVALFALEQTVGHHFEVILFNGFIV